MVYEPSHGQNEFVSMKFSFRSKFQTLASKCT